MWHVESSYKYLLSTEYIKHVAYTEQNEWPRDKQLWGKYMKNVLLFNALKHSGGWWEGLDGGCSHKWTDLSPLLPSRGAGRLHFCFSPLQLSFLVELGQGFLLAFLFTCINSVTMCELPGSCCSPSAAALRVFCCFTNQPSKPPKGWSSPTLSHLPLPCTGAFPGVNQPRPYHSHSQDAPRSAILRPLAQELQRHCLLWDFVRLGWSCLCFGGTSILWAENWHQVGVQKLLISE